ncbi:hypothetical protein NKDENANG_01880 [Candidatus Entotheonellaceae bacterium PAL068K]
MGESFRNPDLAQTFERLLQTERSATSQGRTAGLQTARELFYQGEMARQIADFVQRQGGPLDADDLAAFETKVEAPVSINYRGYDVFKCGPWSQAPVCLQQMRLLKGYDLHCLGITPPRTVISSPRWENLPLQIARRTTAVRTSSTSRYQNSGQKPTPRRQLIDPDQAWLELRPGDPQHGKALRSEQASLMLCPIPGRWTARSIYAARNV